MKVVATRRVVVVGARPRVSAADVLGDLRPGEEAVIFVLGLDPTPRQRRLAHEALSLAAERRFVLTAELIPGPSGLRERLREEDAMLVVTGRREARRWKLEHGEVFNASGG